MTAYAISKNHSGYYTFGKINLQRKFDNPKKRLYSIEDFDLERREIVGFQVAVRQRDTGGHGFRDPFSRLIVDGVEIQGDVVTWIISGVEYTVRR